FCARLRAYLDISLKRNQSRKRISKPLSICRISRTPFQMASGLELNSNVFVCFSVLNMWKYADKIEHNNRRFL
ncbi:hypothetical protein KAU92_05710, partial [Candidatus Bathyarchaeota archaeon]|nr:hypothetical protein [Candidatus Bathyarchaeota archaeon]